MASLKFYRQRPIKGGREALPACVLKSIYQEVDRQARKHHVSRSFVIATVLAKAFGVEDQEDYTLAAEARKNPPPAVDLTPPAKAPTKPPSHGAKVGTTRTWAPPALT